MAGRRPDGGFDLVEDLFPRLGLVETWLATPMAMSSSGAIEKTL